MVFQDPMSSFNPSITVGEPDQRGARAPPRRQVPKPSGRHRTARAVGIPDAARRVEEYPHQFSGGMRQRAVIAMALACDPDLLICDEPTTALDVTIQAQILELLEELQEERDLGIMFITHDMGVIAEIADRVNVMYAGEIVERHPSSNCSNHQHPYTQGLLRLSPAGAPGRTAATIEGDVPTPNETGDVLPVRPPVPEGLRPSVSGSIPPTSRSATQRTTPPPVSCTPKICLPTTLRHSAKRRDQTVPRQTKRCRQTTAGCDATTAGNSVRVRSGPRRDARADGGHGHSAGDTGGQR